VPDQAPRTPAAAPAPSALQAAIQIPALLSYARSVLLEPHRRQEAHLAQGALMEQQRPRLDRIPALLALKDNTLTMELKASAENALQAPTPTQPRIAQAARLEQALHKLQAQS
jgi:hypothetical protein